MTVQGNGNADVNIFNCDCGYFSSLSTKINNSTLTTGSCKYNFNNNENNIVKLSFINNLTNCSIMFKDCTNI